MTKDHFFPRSEGYDLANNMVMACTKCNSSKGNNHPKKNQKDIFDMMIQLGFSYDDAKILIRINKKTAGEV